MSDEPKPQPEKNPVACTGSEFVVTPEKLPDDAPVSHPQTPDTSNKPPE